MTSNLHKAAQAALDYWDSSSFGDAVMVDKMDALRAALAQPGAEPTDTWAPRPGQPHEVDAAFYKLTVMQRDSAWREVEALKAEIERLTTELAEHQKSAAWCDKHKPDGGHRAVCVICAGEKLSAALSRISYLCGEPNEMECSAYDVFPDEDAVVAQVRTLTKERDALRLDAERYRWLCVHRLGWFSRMAPIPWKQQSMKDALDAAIDAAMKEKP